MTNKRIIFLALLFASLMGGALTMVLLWRLGVNFDHPAPGPVKNVIPVAASREETVYTPEEENNIRIYEQLNASVVNITTTEVSYDFFLDPVHEMGTGSGSILDQDGHILTNYHVIEQADYIHVTINGKNRYKAEVTGVDQVNDLAVLKIEAPRDQLRPIAIGRSRSLKAGQKVFAIGNPFGLSHTMTIGIISSLGRSIKSKQGFIIDNVIQTDAAINPGNSGGPLIDSNGRMIGVNTSIFTTSGGSIGIGFAVPSDTAVSVAGDIIKFGKVRRPWIGIIGQDVSSDLARYLDLPADSGVLVAEVENGSSADRSGIQGGDRRVRLGLYRFITGGDLIVQIDDRPVSGMTDLSSILLNHRPGDTVTCTLFRKGRKIQVSLQLIEKPRGLRL